MQRKSRQQVIEEKKDKRIPTTRYQPEYKVGLNGQQVQEHRLHGWTNQAVDPPAKTTREIVHENVFTYFNLIFTILALLLCIAGSFRSLTFLPVIILNTLIGIIQEVRAKKVLDNLTMLNAPHAMVVRDGEKTVIDAEELVLDDIVIFKAGNQVCADAEVCAGEVQVNESLLTGESDEVTKRKGDQLMSGSFIVSGQCHARLDKVGADSYISKLTIEAKEMQEGEQSEMIRSLDKLVKCVGIAIIPIGIVLFVQAFFFQNAGFQSSITSMVAAVIGMIPEGLYLLASVALAVSSVRLAQKKVLLHDMKCIETLARVNVLCVDKTGTITENTMKVQEVITANGYDSEKMEPLSMLIGDFVAAMDSDNITMAAVKEHFQTGTGKKPVSKTGFSSATKYSSVTFEDQVYVLGAPEFVLLDQYCEQEEEITGYASKGARVLVFGTYDGEIDGKALKKPITPLGYLLLANPIRKEAKETFTYFKEQGVEVKVISGDNPVTVSEVAKKAGIANAEHYVDASSLKSEEELRKAVLEKTVFGRVTPNQKRQFVQILKEEGKTVAMTGDGVNDVLALKDADCSIAMASGSEAAAQASQLVLLESDFSCMPQVVLEGRRVVNNIQRSASLFLVKNIFSFLLSLFSVVFMITYPLEPSQVSLISMFTIGVPAFFLALEPNKNIIKGHFLTNVFLKALPAALTDVIAVGALVVFGQTFGVNPTDISTAATMLLAIVGFMILYKISAPMNILRTTVVGGSIIGLLFCSIFLHQLFAITGMSTKCIMLFVVFSIATEPVLRYLTALVGKLRLYYLRLRGRPVEEQP
ncbi:cation-translocating P-type ATPase [Faecalicatena sp. AGMB00832]|uniref:Cation-translocating P-type ATPase n=1 Tax=Faecalicatena faecalis TaxID=2726362 RepID=A0ABS6D9T5_9FIRM|nr:cation-translocating P-type ATPase [Faecalicatena faecalis]MBU3878389.1 cation-translocating P-type ATPase [Faecalicatena faecalis]